MWCNVTRKHQDKYPPLSTDDSEALSRYHLNDPMRLIIAIVLGTLAVRGAPFQLGLRGYDHDANGPAHRRDDEQVFHRGRERRSKNAGQSAASGTTQATEHHTNSRLVMIFNPWTEHFLQVSKDGRVNGTGNPYSENVKFWMESYGTSKVRLLNKVHKRYIAINHRGIVISQKHMTEKSLLHNYSATDHDRFSSTIYPSGETDTRDKWLLTLKKSGRIKNAKRTEPHQRATHFLIIEMKNDTLYALP